MSELQQFKKNLEAKSAELANLQRLGNGIGVEFEIQKMAIDDVINSIPEDTEEVASNPMFLPDRVEDIRELVRHVQNAGIMKKEAEDLLEYIDQLERSNKKMRDKGNQYREALKDISQVDTADCGGRACVEIAKKALRAEEKEHPPL